jgi:hypothetical protein
MTHNFSLNNYKATWQLAPTRNHDELGPNINFRNESETRSADSDAEFGPDFVYFGFGGGVHF